MTSFSSPHVNGEMGGGYGTPEYIVEPLARAIGGFDLDPASGAEPAPYANERIAPGAGDTTTSGGGLEVEWYGDVWLNPPYGQRENPIWADKVRSELDNVDSLTCLVPVSTSANWWQSTFELFDMLAFPGFRIQFVSGDSFAPAGFDTMIAATGELPDNYVDVLGSLSRPGFDDTCMVVCPWG